MPSDVALTLSGSRSSFVAPTVPRPSRRPAARTRTPRRRLRRRSVRWWLASCRTTWPRSFSVRPRDSAPRSTPSSHPCPRPSTRSTSPAAPRTSVTTFGGRSSVPRSVPPRWVHSPYGPPRWATSVRTSSRPRPQGWLSAVGISLPAGGATLTTGMAAVGGLSGSPWRSSSSGCWWA